MARILIPAQDPSQWQQLLAEPNKQWREGYSARTLAHSWHAANGFPPEIVQLLKTAAFQALHHIQPLLIFPEYKVDLPGRGYASQNDIFVLGKAAAGQLVSMTIEGKVEESFGETLAKWKLSGKGFTSNRQERLTALGRLVGLETLLDTLYYQLLHRTASAVIEARTFNAPYAVMIVHSFSPTASHWQAFAEFVQLYGQTAKIHQLVELGTIEGIRLFTGWVQGDSRYLSA